jgi:hypothetical protein
MFMDEVSGGGGAKLLKFDGRAGTMLSAARTPTSTVKNSSQTFMPPRADT